MKILSVKSLGLRDVYSPEMRGHQHNYFTTNSRAVHRNSHAISYCLLAYKCLWMKKYFPEEWWASIMGYCHPDKLVRYIASARSDGVRFGSVDIGRLTIRPAAHSGRTAEKGPKQVALGLINLKQVGASLAEQYADGADEERKTYESLDDFVEKKGKNKTVLERLIKLGAFKHIHDNIRATWMWYVHKHCSGEISLDGRKVKVTSLKKEHEKRIAELQGITPERIKEEKEEQIRLWKNANPKKTTVPKKLQNYTRKPKVGREEVMGLYPDDYDLRELLDFEKQFLGYYWHSPVDLYHTSGTGTVEHAKIHGMLEGVIIRTERAITRNGNPYMRLIISDGVQEALVFVWGQELELQDDRLLLEDNGVRLRVSFDLDRGTFSLHKGSIIQPLWTKKAWEELESR